jgi:hypothetical protein
MMRQLPYILVVLATCGEFGFAAVLWLGHGDLFPLYLASLYFVRERWSGLKFVAVMIHRARWRRARRLVTQQRQAAQAA